MNGYKVWVILPRENPATNACVFATEEEATAAGNELLSRWYVPESFEVRPTEDDVNYVFNEGKPKRIP